MRTILALLLVTSAALAQTTPLRNASLQSALNANGHAILDVGNMTFSAAGLESLAAAVSSSNFTISQLHDPLYGNEWSIRTEDGNIEINGDERRLNFLRNIGLPFSHQAGNLTWVDTDLRDEFIPQFREALQIPASNNATALTTGTLAAARLPTLTLNTSGVLHASPVTFTAGVGNMTLQPQSPNTVFAGPASGNATATPTFRALTSADLPGNATLSGNVSIGTLSVGSLTANATLLAPAFAGSSLFGPLYLGGSGVINSGLVVQQGSSGFVVMPVAAYLGWSGSGNLASLHDLRLYRDDAGRLGQRHGTNPQSLGVYNTFTSNSNFERIDLAWSGNVATVGPVAAGNGTLRPMTLSGSTVTVPGNTVLGDAGADTVTINAATITAPNASGATADAVMTRQLLGLEGLLGASRMPVPITASSVSGLEATAFFTAPILTGPGLRFNNGNGSASGSYSGATLAMVAGGPGPGNVVAMTSRFALEFTYAQGSNSAEVVFVATLGQSDRRNLTARGIGMEIVGGNGTVTLKAHDGTSQATAVTTAETANIFYRRYILLWDGLRTLSLYRANVNAAAFTRPEMIGSVQVPANVSGSLSTGDVRFGFWATATLPSNQDSFVKNVIFHRF